MPARRTKQQPEPPSCTIETWRPRAEGEEYMFPKTTEQPRIPSPLPLSSLSGTLVPAGPLGSAAWSAGGENGSPSREGRRGEAPALLPREAAAAAPGRNPALGPRPSPGYSSTALSSGWEPAPGFSVSQSGFRFRAILCRKQYAHDA